MLSVESLSDCVDFARFLSNFLVVISPTSAVLSCFPKISTMASICCGEIDNGSEHAERTVCEPRNINGSESLEEFRCSNNVAHTGQHGFDTPMTRLAPYIYKYKDRIEVWKYTTHS
jgi:hypothetical protein